MILIQKNKKNLNFLKNVKIFPPSSLPTRRNRVPMILGLNKKKIYFVSINTIQTAAKTNKDCVFRVVRKTIDFTG